MKREIKFRALKDDISNSGFVYGQLVYDAIGVPRITVIDRSGQGLLFNSCLRKTESQYTGLKDKNGKEIYEGDIVQIISSGKIHEIIYHKCSFGIILNNDVFAPIYWHEDINVIGNIHENPELIKN